jgi:ATP-dependent 26S proteasome regulatory subunit
MPISEENKIKIYTTLLQMGKNKTIDNDLSSLVKQLGLADSDIVTRIDANKSVRDWIKKGMNEKDTESAVSKLSEEARNLAMRQIEKLSQAKTLSEDVGPLTESDRQQIKEWQKPQNIRNDWSSLIGLPKGMQAIREKQRTGKLFRKTGFGILLYGPPGTGKTAGLDALQLADPDMFIIRVDASKIGSLQGSAARFIEDQRQLYLKAVAAGYRGAFVVEEADQFAGNTELISQLQILMNNPKINLVVTTNYPNTLRKVLPAFSNRLTTRVDYGEVNTKKNRQAIFNTRLRDLSSKYNFSITEGFKELGKTIAADAGQIRDLNSAFNELENVLEDKIEKTGVQKQFELSTEEVKKVFASFNESQEKFRMAENVKP